MLLSFDRARHLLNTGTVIPTNWRRRNQPAARPLHAALVIIGLAAPVLSALLHVAIPDLFPFMNNDPEVIRIGIDYIRWLILQAVFAGFIAACTGFCNGIGASRICFTSLLAMHAATIGLNYIFIFGWFWKRGGWAKIAI